MAKNTKPAPRKFYLTDMCEGSTVKARVNENVRDLLVAGQEIEVFLKQGNMYAYKYVVDGLPKVQFLTSGDMITLL